MKIAVIGVGVIGRALYQAGWKVGFNPLGFDPHLPQFGEINETILECEVAFVSVPTATINGVQDLEPIKDVCSKLKSIGYNGVVCIRCTVLPGTCSLLSKEFGIRIVHMPEFLTEANAEKDFLAQNKLWLSGAPSDRILVMEAMFGMVPQKQGTSWVCKMSDDFCVTEMQKYMANCLKAVKISACNEIYAACEKAGIDYEQVREFAIEVDGVGANHTAVSSRGKLGYSGMCFPKDMAAFSCWLNKNSTRNEIFNAAIKSNEKVRPHNNYCKEI